MTKTPSAAKVVAGAALGLDYKTVLVGGHRYVIHPPTIKRIAGAAYHLADISETKTIADILLGQTDLLEAATALSWFIQGDAALKDEIADGTLEEVTAALATAYSLISVQSFTTLSVLARNATALTAKQRQ